MSSAQIRFATDILRRLGEELNPSPDKGIIELVKNAYDADARTCTIELIQTDQPGGSVKVVDDGDGMGADDIEDGWLVIGRSGKSQNERTRLGRIPAGSKGLGRLAALRMGSAAMLTTYPRAETTSQYDLLIDWMDFENVEHVDDVKLRIEQSKRTKANKTGTEIHLEDLKIRIGRMDAKRLARELILLADPFGDDPEGFKPLLKAPEYSDLEAIVQKRYFDDAEYHLVGSVNADGRATASVVDWRGEILFSADHDELTASRERHEYRCSNVEFDLWVFILNRATFLTRSSTLGEVRNWLQEFGGVHLYHNGLRVMPYGNPGNDWLDMNLRRVRSPEERPGTNTAIGRVRVSDTDDLFIQKTDRSGFIEGDAFLELRSFTQDTMEWMAKRRLEVAEKRRAKERASAPRKSSRSKQNLNAAISRIPTEFQQVLIEALDAYDRSRDREVRNLQKEVQLYRTLSTAGITAATFAHESNAGPIKTITLTISAIERRARKALRDAYDRTLKEPVERITRAISSLEVPGAATLKLVQHEKRRISHLDLHTVIEGVIKTFRPFLDEREVCVKLCLCNGAPYLSGSEAAVESIVTNLINNSITAFEQSNVDNRKILIRTSVTDDVFELRFLDNGPGIEGISKNNIWLPGETTRANGTGLGLTIVRDAVNDLGGAVDAIERGELGGAEIAVDLPILGV